MTRLVAVILFVSFTSEAYAQEKWTLGVGLSHCQHQTLLTDPGNLIVLSRGPSLMFNVDLRRRVKDIWFVETGLFVKPMAPGFGFKGHFFTGGGNAPHLLVPLRLLPMVPVIKNKLFVSPVFGVSLGYNTNYGEESEGHGFVGRVENNDTLDAIHWEEQDNHRFNRTYLLFQVGVSVELVFENQSALQLRSSYYLGRSKLSEKYVQYRVDKNPFVHATLESNGTFWQLLGISYLFPLRKPRPAVEIPD